MIRIRGAGIVINTRNIEGTRTIAVPVRAEDGDACATLAFVGTISAISSDPSSPMAVALMETADKLCASTWMARRGARAGGSRWLFQTCWQSNHLAEPVRFCGRITRPLPSG